MITLQHSLCNLIRYDGNVEEFEKELPYCLLPDAIRFYFSRPYSHFEQNPEGTDVSWYKFPTDLKSLTKEKALSQPMHLASTSLKSVLGEKSIIDKYLEINHDLPREEFYGILIHLIQDYLFDEFIRDNFDYSHKYEPDAYFIFENKKYNGIEIRKEFLKFGEYGFYLLAFYCYKVFGIVTDQKWFDEHVYKVLIENYPKDLADNTYKYMIIPEEINTKIANKDFSGLVQSNYNKKYSDFYSNVINYTRDITDFFIKYYNDNKKDDSIKLNKK